MSPQAAISQWDTHVELQRASLSGRHRGNGLLEQEKQRTLALQREELATFHKMQSQHRQEQQRWERERERHRCQAEATEAQLHQREEACRRLEVGYLQPFDRQTLAISLCFWICLRQPWQPERMF